MIAALLRRQLVRCRSRQLYARLIWPPMNHFANGSFHSQTFFHGLNQWSSLENRAQNFWGCFSDSAWSFLYVAADLMCACFTNAAAGLNFLPSFCSETMSV